MSALELSVHPLSIFHLNLTNHRSGNDNLSIYLLVTLFPLTLQAHLQHIQFYQAHPLQLFSGRVQIIQKWAILEFSDPANNFHVIRHCKHLFHKMKSDKNDFIIGGKIQNLQEVLSPYPGRKKS